ncbi:hypothetical protein BH20VER1_BH20VER1_23050 [soil metagenome]
MLTREHEDKLMQMSKPHKLTKKNNMKLKILLSISVAAILAFGSSAAFAVPITVTSGSGGNAGTENVLFNDPSLLLSGPLVQGNFAGNGSGYIIEFRSSSGSGLLMGSGGQATLTGGPGNNFFTQLTFNLADSATFTRAIFNIDASVSGAVQIVVNYILDGTFHEEIIMVGQSGSNFFSVDAGMGALITSISLQALSPVEFRNINNFRIGGFAPAGQIPVPEGGATLMLLGVTLGGLALGRRALLKRSSAA